MKSKSVQECYLNMYDYNVDWRKQNSNISLSVLSDLGI